MFDNSLIQGALFTDPDGLMDGTILFYTGEIRDGQGEIAGTRLFALYADHTSGEIRSANPAILWDLQEGYTALTPAPSPIALGEGKLPRPSQELIEIARELRKKATTAEDLLWQILRNRQLLGRKFRRQHPIGQFIADFFCDDARLVIELDGSIHQETSQQERDRAREQALQQHGFYIMRFANAQVLETPEEVIKKISDYVQAHSFEQPVTPPPHTLVERGQGGEGILEALKRRAIGILLPGLEEYRQTLLKERERQALIKEKYGLQSLEKLVLKLDGDLITLYDRREQGQNVDLVIRNKEEQKARYEHAFTDLQQNLARERNLTLSTPQFLGAARVMPGPGSDSMSSDAEIERIGMEEAMRYERSQGRSPEDVAAQNLGFDIRSSDRKGQKFYIEVKARAEVGAVSLTQNEWFKAKRFQDDYHLYVVLKAASKPELWRIQNPAAVLNPDEQVEVRYIITAQQILNMATQTN
jgi:very-short-patch-repair endonuclease